MNVIQPLFLAVAAALFFVSCAQTNNTTKVPVPTAQEQVIAKRVFSLVNAERASRGKPPLRGSQVLNKMAQQHSRFLGTDTLADGKPSHFGTRNRAQYAFLKHGIENMGEIVYTVPASTPDPAGATVRAWKRSVKTRDHLNQTWELTGVGVYKTSHKVYLTMLVGIVPAGVPRSMQPMAWR